MELTTKRKLTALGTNNMKKMVVIMSTVLAYIIFTCRSYEYQILLAKTFIIDVVFVHSNKWYPRGNVTADINWIDTETCQGLQERSYRGYQITIYSSTSSLQILSNPSSTSSTFPTPLYLSFTCRYYTHLLCHPHPPLFRYPHSLLSND